MDIWKEKRKQVRARKRKERFWILFFVVLIGVVMSFADRKFHQQNFERLRDRVTELEARVDSVADSELSTGRDQRALVQLHTVILAFPRRWNSTRLDALAVRVNESLGDVISRRQRWEGLNRGERLADTPQQ